LRTDNHGCHPGNVLRWQVKPPLGRKPSVSLRTGKTPPDQAEWVISKGVKEVNTMGKEQRQKVETKKKPAKTQKQKKADKLEKKQRNK